MKKWGTGRGTGAVFAATSWQVDETLGQHVYRIQFFLRQVDIIKFESTWLSWEPLIGDRLLARPGQIPFTALANYCMPVSCLLRIH